MEMMWRILGVLGLAVGLGVGARAELTMPRQNLSLATPRQWAEAFAMAKTLPLGARIGLWADLAAVDAAYVGDPLGEGPGAQPDPDPLCDFTRVDCVTYLEQVLALALSPDAAAFPDTLRRLRYRDGTVDYRWRNHYFVSDWLPANAWAVRDVTEAVGAGVTRPMTKTIDRGAFFAGKGLAPYADLPAEEQTTTYIPRDKVAAVLPKLKTGDLAIFVMDTPGIIAGHTGLIRRPGPDVALQHASLTAQRVVTVPLLDYWQTAPARFVGMKVARVSEGK